MIYTTGYITMITSVNMKPMNDFNSRTLSLEKLEEERAGETFKVKYAFTAFLPRSYECRFLEDYTGKIKPFIEKQIPERIVSLQVTHLNYMSEQAMKKMNKKKR